jgi:hypothetical protein
MFRFSGERPVLLIQERSDALADVELGVGVVALVQLGSLDLIAGFATRNGTCGRRTDPRPDFQYNPPTPGQNLAPPGRPVWERANPPKSLFRTLITEQFRLA